MGVATPTPDRTSKEALGDADEEVRGGMQQRVHEGHQVCQPRLLRHAPQHGRPRHGVKAVAQVEPDHHEARVELQQAAHPEDEH